MANEIRVRAGLFIEGDTLKFRSHPTEFQADLTNEKGPTPGAIAIAESGTDIDLSQLTDPGWAEFHNISAAGIVIHIGSWDGTEFYPVFELAPGEFSVLKVSQFLSRSFGTGTGTGTFDTGDYNLRAKSVGGAGKLDVAVFDR